MNWNIDPLPLAWGKTPEESRVICNSCDNYFEVKPKNGVGDTFKGFPISAEAAYIYVDVPPGQKHLEVPAKLALDCCNIALIPSGVPEEFRNLHIYITKERWDGMYLTELTGWPFRGPGGDRPFVFFGTNLAVLCGLLPKKGTMSRTLMDMLVPRNKPYNLSGDLVGMYAKATVVGSDHHHLHVGSMVVMPPTSKRIVFS